MTTAVQVQVSLNSYSESAMAITRKIVKVFLASPGDLVDERKTARTIVDEFNSQLAEALGYQVELVGWEDTLPGLGRPQEIINRDLDGCDFFVGMLWKRWGTAPGTEPYTSGFEEEFYRAMARHEKEGRPEISLLLKEIDAASLADPGIHLSQVQKFKSQVFAERKLLAGTFTDARDFETKFRRCIQGYVIGLNAEEKATASEKDQAPLVDQDKESLQKDIKADSIAPNAVGGAAFLGDFAAAIENAPDGQALWPEEVARVRLLASISAMHSNDQHSLGTHDANLLYKARTKFPFSRRELLKLLDAGLDHSDDANVPLWHWLKAVNGFRGNRFPICSVVGPTDRRIRALKAMSLICEPIGEEKEFGRKDFIRFWLSERAESALKVAALEYLGACGKASDLPAIQEEYTRNETQTAGAAVDAIVRITLRENRSAALNVLITLQPNAVARNLLNMLFEDEAEFDNDILLRSLNHRCSSVRAFGAKLLRSRKALTVSMSELLLEDDDAEVRHEAMQALIANGRPFTLAQASALLVRNNKTQTARGLLAMSRKDIVGEYYFERYKKQYFDAIPTTQLEELERSEFLDLDSYFSLARRDFQARGDDLRNAAGDQFKTRFNAVIDDLAKLHGSASDLVESARNLGSFLCGKFTREALNIICSQRNPADLTLVRSILSGSKIEYSSFDLQYLTDCGEWSDIPLIIELLERPDYGVMYREILFADSTPRDEEAARALYSLGGDRLEDLLGFSMPASLLARLIALIPGDVFSRMSNKIIMSLLRSENEEVRRVTSLKFACIFPRRKIQQFLEKYMSADQVYYNVIHWLDFSISVPRERMLHAAGRLIAKT